MNLSSKLSISFNDKIIDVNCNSEELIKHLKKSKIIIRPSDYEGLRKLINSKFNPKEKKNQTLCITGILPSGERIEITDNETYSKNISLFLVSYKKEIQSTLFPSFKPESFFQLKTPEIPKLTKSKHEFKFIVDNKWLCSRQYEIIQDKDNYNDREHYELPYYYLGNWMMNMFRNVKDRKNDINYSKFDKQDYTEADDRARLYGNYFIIEFGFNMNDSKYIGEKSDKFEFQSIEINVSQQFLQQ